MNDIHVELTRGWDLPATGARPDFDVLVVAGDLIPRMERGVAWLAQRLHRIESGKDTTVSWASLCEQFGPGYAHVREFRRVFKHTLAQVKVVYPDARFELSEAGMCLQHSRPPVARRLLPVGP